MTLQKIIGERLRALREHRGLSINEAADLAGCDSTTLYNHERGKFRPRIDLLQKILRVYDYSLSKFFAKWEKGEPV